MHRAAVIKLQGMYRRLRQQTRYRRLRVNSIRIQCFYRIIFAKRAIFHLRRKVNATRIQARWRVTRDSRRFRSMVSSAVVIQSIVRGSLQRPKYRQALFDKAEQAKLENQLAALQRKLEEAEAKRVEAEKVAEERASAAIAQYKEAQNVQERESNVVAVEEEQDGKNGVIENEFSSKTVEAHNDQTTLAGQSEAAKDISDDQQQLMDESTKMLEYLRKEVFKLRSQNQQLKTDFDLLKDNNQRLMDANASAGASFAALNQHAKQLSKQNAQLVGEVQSFKGQVQKLNILQVELKEELKMKNATYVAEVQSRLQYQKALQKITDIVTDSCRDHRLVERVLKVADDVEMDLMSTASSDQGRNNVDTDDDEDVPNEGSRSGLLGFFWS
jgi:myosin heavy subunit